MEDVESEQASANLQWKNTDACLDLWCPCGTTLHFDGYFANELTCGNCGRTWGLPHGLTAEAAEPAHPLTLIFDAEILSAEPGALTRIRWPRPVLDGAKPGDILTVVDEVKIGENGSSDRSHYVDLVSTEPSAEHDAMWLTVRTRGGT